MRRAISTPSRPALDPAGHRDGDGDADMAERRHQREAAEQGDGKAGKRGMHRRRGVLAGKEDRRKRLHQHMARQAERKGGERRRGRRGIGGA